MVGHIAFRMYSRVTGSIHELHRHRRRRLNRLLWGFRRKSRCGRLLTPLLLSNLASWHVCLVPPVLLLRLIIRQGRLSPPFSLLLKISSSQTCTRTVRLVIFTTDLHGVVTLREYIEAVAPLPTVDVMAVIVLTTSVTRQSPHTASKARHVKNKERNCADISSRAMRLTNKHVDAKNQHEDTMCGKPQEEQETHDRCRRHTKPTPPTGAHGC